MSSDHDLVMDFMKEKINPATKKVKAMDIVIQ